MLYVRRGYLRYTRIGGYGKVKTPAEKKQVVFLLPRDYFVGISWLLKKALCTAPGLKSCTQDLLVSKLRAFNKDYNQCCGSESGSGSAWIRIDLDLLDPDQGNRPKLASETSISILSKGFCTYVSIFMTYLPS